MGERVDRDENGEKLKEHIRTENGGFDFLEKCGEIGEFGAKRGDFGMKMWHFERGYIEFGHEKSPGGLGMWSGRG